MGEQAKSYRGQCSCGESEFLMKRDPLFVHCCHCTYCQRETGASYGLNALVEAAEISLTKGEPERVELPSNSGKGQSVYRCSTCKIALWSHYGAGGEKLSFVRVGTLDEASHFTPSIHIYTSTKQPWITLSDAVPSVAGYYSAKEHWPTESLERARAMRAG